MFDTRDAEDRRLLEAGELDVLLEVYYGAILRRCRARIRNETALDVAADIVLRLRSELSSGQADDVLFRVLVERLSEEAIAEHLGQELELGEYEPGPVVESSPEELALVRARLAGTTTLTAARAGLGVPVDDVVERLRIALGLRESLRDRLKKAYQDLEREVLPPGRVHDSVWNALRDILRVDARRLVRRSTPTASQRPNGSASSDPGAPAQRFPDEVDLLFRGAGLR
jgi:hypothetical protein